MDSSLRVSEECDGLAKGNVVHYGGESLRISSPWLQRLPKIPNTLYAKCERLDKPGRTKLVQPKKLLAAREAERLEASRAMRQVAARKALEASL